jgi:hypothetical protein
LALVAVPLPLLCSGVALHNLPRAGKEARMREAIEERPDLLAGLARRL